LGDRQVSLVWYGRRSGTEHVRPDDWEHIHRYASVPEFSQYDVCGPNSVDDTKRFVAECSASLAQHPVRRYELAAELKAGANVIGGCTLKRTACMPRAIRGTWPLVA
jgi:hypothetical protein